MTADFKFQDKYGMPELLELMRILRSPDGCPWDKEQTHHTIRHNFLEETYEVLEAIDTDDPVLLKEELGDVLLQVVFHARMEEEKNVFSFEDVADGLCKKLIVRHPHVFGDTAVKDSGEVLSNWDDIKRQTKGITGQSEAMASVPKVFPALMKSQKIQDKAKKAGFDWDSPDGAFEKIGEETAELRQALELGDPQKIEDELGDLLFSVVNAARFCRCEAETALSKSTDKFIRRFTAVERMAGERGVDMKKAPLEELDKLWDEAKLLDSPV